MKENKFFHISIEEYSNFKNVIKQTLDSISNLKLIEYQTDLIKLEKVEKLFSEFLFFSNFPKLISLDLCCISPENDNILNALNKIKINLNNISNNDNIIKLLFHLQIFLLDKIENSINLIFQKSDKLFPNNLLIQEINQSHQIIIQILFILLKIYKEKKIELNKIILFFDAIIIFLNKNNNKTDKYLKVKNKFFLELLIEKYFGYFLVLLSNEQETNKDEIILIIFFILKVLNNDKLKQNFNYEIMVKNGLIGKLISNILNIFKENKNIDIYSRYKNEMVICFVNIFKSITHDFNFFKILINQNKESFINLFNYKNRKSLIIKDFYFQNFYLELLYKLFKDEIDCSNNIKTEENYFAFNGYNSKMTFDLNEFSLNNSIIFFSFVLSKEASNLSSINFPLINFESKSGDISCKIYLHKESNDNYKLYLYQEFKERGNDKEIKISFDKIENILSDKFYILSIKFHNKKIGIFITDLYEKNKIIFEENDISKVDDKTPILKIGHNDKREEYFKGYFGPFFIIKNLETKNNYKDDGIINSILDLKNLYKFFPFLLPDSSFYNFDEKIFFNSLNEENEIKNLKILFFNYIEKFKCEMYLSPEMFNIYHSLILNKKKGENCFLYEVPNMTNGQKYKIIDNNISTSKKSYVKIDFLQNNGFDYFILIFEYYYQFFKLLENDKNEFDFYSNDNNLENIFINSIKIILSIIENNFTFYKYIITYTKKYKTLFRNLSEILKIKNKNTILEISKELYGLFFQIKNELDLLRYESESKKDAEKILSNLSDGLIDIIYDYEIYLNSQNNDNLNLLFQLTIKILKDYKINRQNVTNIVFPFKENFFLKLLDFIKLLKNSFTNNNNKKNFIIDSYFNLIKIYLDSFNDKNRKRYYCRKLYFYIIENFKNNLNIVMYILHFINEVISEIPKLEDFEFFNGLFLNQNMETKIEKNKNENRQLFLNFNALIFNIILKMSIIDCSDEIIEQINLKLANINDTEVFSVLIPEFEKIFLFFLKYEINLEKEKNMDLNNKLDYMNIFGKIFEFIVNLLKSIVMKYQTKISEEHKEELDKKINELFSKLLNLLNNLLKTLSNFDKFNINYAYCLINFLIFYYRIIFSETKILIFSDEKFTYNLIEVIKLCNANFLINCFQLFKFKIANSEYNKTIIEIIYDIFVQFFLNNEYSYNCYSKLLEEYNFILYDRNFIDNVRHSIFYVNDHIKYILEKDINLNDVYLQNKFNFLKKYNTEYFVEENIFDGNMVTYFISLIFVNLKLINQQKEYKIFISPISSFTEFFDELFHVMLEDHSILYKLNKKYFYYKISYNYPDELLRYIKRNYVKKKNRPSIEEVKNNIGPILENFKKENFKKLDDKKQNLYEIKIDINRINKIKNVKSYNKTKESLSDDETKFLYHLDKNYVTNIKKEIMNCIFSYYYLDEFFYSNDFHIIKKYYMNNYLDKKENYNTKKLNFPSIIKNYRNNFEPPLFVKKFNNYLFDPYFPITHSYIENEFLKSKLIMEKSIKLYPKEIYNDNNDKNIECELLKNENAFYGKIFYNDFGNYLLFKEQTINFSEEEGFEHIFLLSYYFENKNKKDKNDKAEIFNKRNYTKNILIILDDIEEIIEMRILLLWKGFEIFLKNGKSYIFNFLTTKAYNNFMSNFLNKSKINNLIRKRNFLSDVNYITNIWVRNLLTNYEYLLILNRYSSRSFNDPTQYPVFPWLLNDYKNFDLFYKQGKNYKLIKNEYKEIKMKIKNNNSLKSILKNKESLKNYINIMNILKNLIDDENINLENIITILETTHENNMKKDIPSAKITKKNPIEIKNKDDEEIKRYNSTYVNNFSFNYSQYFKLLKKANNKIKKLLRNFKYPPSIHDENKKPILKFKYEEESTNCHFPFHYGIHYSNSAYIYFYLMRQQPYDNLLVKTQTYKLEDPNRTFRNLLELNQLTDEGNDNRELIPELFSKIEMFINLNCDAYGIIHINKKIVDDYEIDYSTKNPKNSLSDYVYLILKHKSILNNKLIGSQLKYWIDIIFGVMQLPPVDKRSESYNIFEKESYEQNLNLEKKLEKKLKKKEKDCDLTNTIIKNKINYKINHIINFGVTPSQLFKKEHPKLEWIINNNYTKKEKGIEINHDFFQNNIMDEHGLEGIIKGVMKPNNISCKINGEPLFFSINPTINRIFVYNKEDNLIILNSQLYNGINSNYSSILNDNIIKKTNIISSKDNQLYQIKYSFSSFHKNITSNDDFDSYHTYYYNKINSFNTGKIKNELNDNSFDNFIIITGRHIDFSFKIHYFEKIKYKNKKNIIKKPKNKYKNITYSFICEDFVTCCSCVSSNTFIIGLNNGKLIYYTLNKKEMIINSNQTENIKTDFTVKKEMYIQGHCGIINTIEIDNRLGVVITSGDDNYIFIRKLYDFELLLPIKIKSKYIILMAKVSSYNFLYILCFNKINNKKIIFGYTLSGMKFAKSEYALYDNINFDETGNIITLNNKNYFTILSGSDLTILKSIKDEENITKGIQGTNWLQFDHFMEERDDELDKVITFFENNNGSSFIKASLYK